MITRRNFIHVLLALLLLCSQQVLVAHGVSHWSEAQKNGADHKQLLSDKACDQCLVFAQIGSALNSHAISFATFSVGTDIQLASVAPVLFSRTLRAYLSRAPPAII